MIRAGGTRHAAGGGWRPGTGVYYVLVAEDGSVLGRFNLVLAGDGTAELGYRVAQHVAGRGLATATVRELCRLAAAGTGCRRSGLPPPARTPAGGSSAPRARARRRPAAGGVPRSADSVRAISSSPERPYLQGCVSRANPCRIRPFSYSAPPTRLLKDEAMGSKRWYVLHRIEEWETPRLVALATRDSDGLRRPHHDGPSWPP